MSEFALATLQAFSGAPYSDKQLTGPVISVQFNPATLRLQMANNVDMTKAFGAKPVTQYTGTSSSILSFDLIFDTADEADGADGAPDVRKRVNPLYGLLLPAAPAAGTKTKSVPPLVQFVYGVVRMKGIVTGLNVDYELFAASGVPMRAKAAVTIKEMSPEYLAGRYGSGANRSGGEQDPAGLRPPGSGSSGAAPNGPKSGPAGPDARSAAALAGESAADLMSRLGQDAAGWKGLNLGGLDPLNLPGGLVLDLPLSVDLNLGVTLGVMAGSRTEGPGQAPIGASPSAVSTGAVAPAVITAAGGLQRAIDSDVRATVAAAVEQNRSGFTTLPPVPRPAAAIRVTSGAAGPAGSAVGSAVVAPDQRRLTFGRGVPLRDRVGPSVRYADVVGSVVPVADDPTVPRWRALAPVPSGLGRTKHCGSDGTGCGKSGGCGCGCGRPMGCGR